MSKLRHLFPSVLFSLLLGIAPTFGGQAKIGSIKSFIDNASLVAVVDVKKVTSVEIPTGNGQISIVYVAEAEVLQTLKSDYTPTPKKRTIAIVGSATPKTTAVWQPIYEGRYLAFLKPEQGHYRYSARYAMRTISRQGKLEWFAKNENGHYELSVIGIDEAIDKINKELAAAKQEPDKEPKIQID